MVQKKKGTRIGKTILKRTNLEDSQCLISRFSVKLWQLIKAVNQLTIKLINYEAID